jgi:eukaryotic-like serine/threonine-protein kinase
MESIGRYKLVRKIGSGGMAEVFLARSRGAQGTEKLLVIKKIHPALSRNAKFLDMFVDEAHVAIRLNHTNIVQVYSFEHDRDSYILAMEYVDGTDLLRFRNAVRNQNRRFPFGIAAYIVSEIAKGLDYAHSRCDENGEPLDIVHRDVSPQNILISHEGAAKVADFGIARARWLNEEVGSVKGKFGYMSPEQAEGETVDRRADIYALGVVLYELLINRPLFKFEPGEDPRSIICNTRHPAPGEVEPSVPAALNDVVMRAIAFDPEERYSSARDMARELGRYLHSEKELYDAQSLESFMAEFASDLKNPAADESSESVSSFADAPTKIAVKAERSPTVQNALSALEKKAVVVVTAKFEIDAVEQQADIELEMMRLVDEMAYKSDGVLRKNSDAFSIYLGLVHSAMEDAITAVRLAYDILDAARALSRDNRIDILMKLSVCQGNVHFQEDSERAAVQTFEADPNLVSKCHALTEAANDGQILADSQIFKLGRREYHFQRVRLDNADALRGDSVVDEKPSAYWVQGTRSRKERTEKLPVEGSFYGRKRELKSLENIFHWVCEGATQIHRVSGEMGIGKTRLVTEFVNRLPDGSADVLSVDCLFGERDRPMAAAADSLRAVLSLGEGETGSALGTSLSSLFADIPRYKMRQERFLREFLAAPDRFWARNPTMRRALVQRTAFGLGVALSLRAKLRPVILLVENAHWLDGPSIDVLSELAHERPKLPILVLIIGQPTTLAGRKIAHLKEMEIDEMSDNAIRQIILDRLGTTDSMKSIAEQIIRRSHGNPFFANEIVDSLIEQKIVVKLKGDDRSPVRYRQARPGTIRLPATMQGIAASRIAALPPEQRTVLRAASAIGASFDEETVAALVGRKVDQEIAALTSQGLLVVANIEDGEPVYRFQQPMVREAAYGGLEERDRRRIHRIIAQRLVAASAGGKVVPEVRIAWHLELAGEKEEAGRRYVAAAASAAAIYSDRESLKLLDRAIPLIRPNSRDRFFALTRREQVLRYLGRFAERAAENKEMKRIAGLLDDSTLLAESLNRRAQLMYDLGDYDPAARLLIESLEVTRRSGDTANQVEALRIMAYVAIQGGHLFRAVDCANRALSAVKDQTEASFLLKALTLDVKGYALHQMGYLDDAAPPLAEALVLFRKLGSHRNESQVMHHLALLAWARGELAESVEFLERALRIDTKVRAARPRGLKLAAMGEVRIDIGDFEGATENLADAKRICQDNDERVGLAEAEMALARLKIIEGDHGDALDILERLGTRPVVSQSRILLVWHRQLTVAALLGVGRLSAALKLADEAARIALESGMNGEAVHGGVLQGLVLAEAGRHGEAASATRRATDMLVMLRKVRSAEQIWWHQALTFQKTGDTYLAERALDEAVLQVDKKRTRLQNSRYLELYNKHPLTRAVNNGLQLG